MTSHLMTAALAAAAFGLAACSSGGSGGGGTPAPAPASPGPVAPEPKALPDPAPPSAGPDFHPAGAGWSLVWSDEFDGTSLDAAKWRPETSCYGGGNDQRECYTGRTENVQVMNGVLRLIARKETYTGPLYPEEFNNPGPQGTQDYTSGKVRTRGLHSWKYGRFEIRARAPAGQGMWPAIWMMPADDLYGGWPLSGEIDIMEAVNLGATCTDCVGSTTENRTSSALHFGDSPPGNTNISHRTELASLANPADDYHVFAVEWGEGLMHFYVDGVRHWTARQDEWWTAAPNAAGNDAAPFDQPFFLMLNLAVGGSWPEGANEGGLDDEALPNQFLIDWVRVYQCAADMDTGRACMD